MFIDDPVRLILRDCPLFMEAGLVPLAPHQRPGVLILVEDVQHRGKFRAYEDFSGGTLAKDAYLRQRADIDSKLASAKAEQEAQEQLLSELEHLAFQDKAQEDDVLESSPSHYVFSASQHIRACSRCRAPALWRSRQGVWRPF